MAVSVIKIPAVHEVFLVTMQGVAQLRQQLQYNSRSLATTTTMNMEDGPERFEKSVNQVTLLGRVGRDAETRGSESHPVVVFSVATNNVYTKADGKTVARVEWHRVSVFKPGLREKVAALLKKG
ncbi:hypothetical protein BaRGS_00031587, partial [Batillaria attramentaria]